MSPPPCGDWCPTSADVGHRLSDAALAKVKRFIPGKAPLVVAGAGAIHGHRWFGVGYTNADGKACVASFGHFGWSRGPCEPKFPTAESLRFLSGGGGNDGVVDWGLAAADVVRVRVIDDTGVAQTIRVVRVGSYDRGFFGYGMPTARHERWIAVTRDGHVTVPSPFSAPDRDQVVPCPNGISTMVPRAGDTTWQRVTQIAQENSADLRSTSAATAVAARERNGKVQRSHGEFESADALLRIYVSHRAQCPIEPPPAYHGIPVEVVVGSPAPVEPATVYPVRDAGKNSRLPAR